MDSGWDDDMDDLELLDQFEAAALKARADRGLSGQAPTSGSTGQQQEGQQGQQPPAVAQGSEQPPAAGAGAARSFYPGDREEVHYTIKEVFAGEEQVLLVHNKYQVRGWENSGAAEGWGWDVAGWGWFGACPQALLASRVWSSSQPSLSALWDHAPPAEPLRVCAPASTLVRPSLPSGRPR